MIDLKKQDNVADAVSQILQQEALKGNQDKIDANHNGKIDAQDFKILRAKKKMKEGVDVDDRTKDTLFGREKTKQKDDVGPESNAKTSKFKLKNEDTEEQRVLANTRPVAVLKNLKPETQEPANKNKEYENKKQLRVKEDTEQIDELSKETLGSYLDKKKSEYMKGKTQSGSKENAKDIQNMGKAHDKMTLKKMKESFEEPILDELINEVMAKDASAGDYIHDFIHSDNPKFAGKSKAKRKEMALAAYYSKKNEETVNEGLKDVAKKAFKALTGGSDEDQRKDLQRKMGVPQTGKKPTSEEVVEEGWDDMVKSAQEKVKSGPKPNGGSGKKEGSAYGGSKQKEKPEQDEVKEAKDPMMDAGCGSQPDFATNDSKPMKHAQTLAKKSLGRMRNEMLGKIAN